MIVVVVMTVATASVGARADAANRGSDCCVSVCDV